jgi:hypothetical protein
MPAAIAAKNSEVLNADMVLLLTWSEFQKGTAICLLKPASLAGDLRLRFDSSYAELAGRTLMQIK